jgi:hypothetical protein
MRHRHQLPRSKFGGFVVEIYKLQWAGGGSFSGLLACRVRLRGAGAVTMKDK